MKLRASLATTLQLVLRVAPPAQPTSVVLSIVVVVYHGRLGLDTSSRVSSSDLDHD